MILKFLRDYPRRTIIVLSLQLLAGLSEGFGVATVLPVIELAGGDSMSSFSRKILQLLSAAGLSPTLPVLLGILVAAISIKAVLVRYASQIAGYASAAVAADLRRALITHLLHASWAYFTKQRSGNIQAAISNEANWAAGAYSSAAAVLAGLVQVTIYVGLSLLVSWQVTVFALGAGTLIFVLLYRMIQITLDASRQQTYHMRQLMVGLSEILTSIKPIKAMACEDRLLPFLLKRTDEIEADQRKIVSAGAWLKALQEPLAALLLAGGMYLGVVYGGWPITEILFLAVIFYRLVSQVGNIQGSLQKMLQLEGGAWAILGTIEKADRARETVDGKISPDFTREIRFADVSFSFGKKKILRSASVSIPHGSFVAFVGPSGAGKTTATDLVLGLQKPTSGSVLIDGVPLETIDLQAWRRRVGYVPQEVLLLDDTVLNNVSLGDPAISRGDVEKALSAAEALDFVNVLPDGLATTIGERGGRLSGGQRQRLAIARALVRKPSLLVLDEVTAALDPATAAEIIRTLRQLTPQVTILAISHQTELMTEVDFTYRVSGMAIERIEGPSADVAKEALTQFAAATNSK